MNPNEYPFKVEAVPTMLLTKGIDDDNVVVVVFVFAVTTNNNVTMR